MPFSRSTFLHGIIFGMPIFVSFGTNALPVRLIPAAFMPAVGPMPA